jgi:hypothetical protein
MPNAIADIEEGYMQPRAHRRSKPVSSSREVRVLAALLNSSQELYNRSQLSEIFNRQLQATLKHSPIPVTAILSLGLGSFRALKDQSRRLKQLTILLAIRDILRRISGSLIQVYAQDPTFTRADEAFLSDLGLHILRTPSGSELGEAASVISPSTLIYSPFLTLEAYENLFMNSKISVQYLVGDDFNALLSKWPKHSAEQAQVEGIMKSGLSSYRRRAVTGALFWTEDDKTFPLAMYEKLDGSARRREKARI